jgi:hypothetical protein
VSENKFDFSKSLAIWKISYLDFMCSSRIFIILFSIICYIEIIELPTLEVASIMGEPINILEPFVNICNSFITAILIPLVMLVLISDFPKVNSKYIFIIFRLNKRNWMVGQVLFIISLGLTYLIAILTVTSVIAMRQGFIANGWSLVTRNLRIQYPDLVRTSNATVIVEKGLHIHYRPYTAVLFSILLMLSLLVLISMILLAFNLIHKRMIGIFTVMAVLILGWLLFIFQQDALWLFPFGNAILGWHNTSAFQQESVPTWYSFVYFFVWIVIMMIITFKLLKQYSFYTTDES